VEVSHGNDCRESLWLLRLAADVLPRHGRRRMRVRDRLADLRWGTLELPGRDGVLRRLCLRALRRRGSRKRRRLSLKAERDSPTVLYQEAAPVGRRATHRSASVWTICRGRSTGSARPSGAVNIRL